MAGFGSGNRQSDKHEPWPKGVQCKLELTARVHGSKGGPGGIPGPPRSD